ncbi:MAG TPA: membrane protein insertion efficiency factor YidD [Methylibium sp.]|uniref:membrane protein insertion efficiency factor YidD n=1 Tax=Methylibium sp. TaxID=2067992 RepID=UPI002DB7C16D|nr:membrane protein insertion efficiency factor YidD [Methylibium sp.]HEU4459516.1 membrane protein insertion efficiency factor YidD [Methylibium sp.]
MSRLATGLLVGLVKFYRLFFSAWLGAGCRFEPSCSAYALEALRRHGALRGGALVVARLARCRPGATGGFEPVPAQPPSWLGRAARHGLRCGCLPSSSSRDRPAAGTMR